MVATAGRTVMAASVGIRLTRATVAYGAVYRDIHCVTPLRAGSRPDAVIPAISALVLVLLTADGPILVRAALRTRHGGAIEAFDFSGAMAQRAGIGWYGHVCSFSSVDAGRLRAAIPSGPGVSQPARAWMLRVLPDRS